MRPGSRAGVLAAITLTLFAATAQRAAAQEEREGDGDGDEAQPRIISASKNASGEHIILAFTPNGARVFAGKPGKIEKLHILALSPADEGYVVGTEERGQLTFNTVERTTVQKGGTGFLAKPSLSFSEAGDAAVIAEVEGKIGLRKSPVQVAQPAAPTQARMRARTSAWGLLKSPAFRAALAAEARQSLKKARTRSLKSIKGKPKLKAR